MKKTKTKSAKGAGKAAGIKAGKPADLAAVREGITNLVGAQALHMVETTIAEAGKGHYVAMKYLFELIGLYPGAEQEAPVGDGVLAKTLLRRLNLEEGPKTDVAVTKGTVAASEENAAHAVE